MIQYKMFEVALQGAVPTGSQAQTEVTAVFSCNQETKTVKGFYDGNGTYKVRFLPEHTGHYTWKVEGVVSAQGEEDCVSSKEYHGLVQVEGNHFRYQDGTKYLPFGTTIYALSHQEETLIAKTMETLKTAPFNKVRHCVFPKNYDYNHNEPEFFAFEKDEQGNWDVNRPCFPFWHHLEQVIDQLSEMGIQSDLILFHPYDRWGLSKLSMEDCSIYLDYLIRRLSANPNVWWSMANEYDLVFNRTMEDWYTFETQIVEEDVYHHLLSNHNCFALYNFTRPGITHCSIQTSLVYKAAAWQQQYQKPVIYDECCYEGDLALNWGNLSGFEMVNRFWCVCALGAYATHGEVFLSPDEILWWAKGGILKGQSPERIAYLKEILYSLPGALEPWAAQSYRGEAAGTGNVDEDPEKNPFFKLINSLSDMDREAHLQKSTEYTGHYGEEVFLKYYARACSSMDVLVLPETGTYRMEVIDVWNMTRETIAEGVRGKTRIQLPGKEGIAVLATKM